MTTERRAAEHHASAATHHHASAQFHREASRHYEVGKDYAHAAHQALIAHGRAMLALDRGSEAGRYYRGQDASTPPKSPQPWSRFTGKSDDPAVNALSAAEHHAAAADRHEKAAHHHGQASRFCRENNFALAAEEGMIAYAHAQRAIYQGDEAAKHHVEHYGKSGPTAEIA